MKTLIIYKSIHHGNTLEVIEEMADVLRADLMEMDLAEKETLKDYDLIGFGSGIYNGRHYKELIKFVRELPDDFLEGKQTFLISTSGMPKIPFLHNFDKYLRESVEAKGGEILDSFNCRGFDNYGFLGIFGGINKNHPNNKDLQKARFFAIKLYRKYISTSSDSDPYAKYEKKSLVGQIQNNED